MIIVWGCWCQKQVSQTVIASHTLVWDAITYPCLRYLLLAPNFSYFWLYQLHECVITCLNWYQSVFGLRSWNQYTQCISYIIPCCYNTVIFLPNPTNRHPIARPWGWDINGLVQERHNSIANAQELRLSCTNQSIWGTCWEYDFWFMFCFKN